MSLVNICSLDQTEAGEEKPHAHAEGQIFIVRSGLVSINANGGRWIMPPGCMGWVPPQVSHGADAHGAMTGLSIYFSQSWSCNRMPDVLKVVRLTPLLSALLDAVCSESPPDPEHLEHYLAVFADAFCRQTPQTLFLPMPREARLLKLSMALMENPDDTTTLDGWADRIGMTRRTLTRHFQAETGWSIAQWRQQLRIMHALECLAAGESVTSVSLSLGYSSVSSFIAVFKRFIGTTPRAYLAT